MDTRDMLIMGARAARAEAQTMASELTEIIREIAPDAEKARLEALVLSIEATVTRKLIEHLGRADRNLSFDLARTIVSGLQEQLK